MRNLQQKLSIARGERPAERLFKNANLVNVLSGEIYRTHVAVDDGRVVGLGDYQAKQVIDLKGAYLAPSLIDGHFHVESSMLTTREFARAVVPHGTGAVVIDPHEYANVLGLDGIRYVLESSKNLPVDFFIMLPSCVPATPLETSGARLTAEDLKRMIGDERIAGRGRADELPGRLPGRGERVGQDQSGQGQEHRRPRPGSAGAQPQRLRVGRGPVRPRIHRAGRSAGEAPPGNARAAARRQHRAQPGDAGAADQSAQRGELLLCHR